MHYAITVSLLLMVGGADGWNDPPRAADALVVVAARGSAADSPFSASGMAAGSPAGDVFAAGVSTEDRLFADPSLNAPPLALPAR